MNVTFIGAAREVTGSCFLVESAQVRFLVDCGMVQGGREAPARNRKPFAFDPKSIDFVLLTHAHIDHSGLLPKLTRAGYQGPILATAATADLLGVMLPDSAHIQESEALRDGRRAQAARSRTTEPTPLYTLQDAQDCLRQVWAVPYDKELVPRAGVRCRFRDAGHILGAAIIEIWLTEHGKTTKLVFSGDLGQPGRAILRDPTRIDEADLLVIEGRFFTVPAHGASAYSVTMGSESDNQPLVTVLDGEGAKVLEISVADFPEKHPFIRAIKHRVSLALSPQGKLFLPFYAMNLVHVFDTAGNKKGGFSRPLAFKPMTPVLLEQRSPERGVVQMRADLDMVSSDAAFGPDGMLYILTATDSLSERVKKPADQRGPAPMRVDVIDPEGYRAARTIDCDAGARAFGVMGQGRLVYVYEDAEGELALRCVRY